MDHDTQDTALEPFELSLAYRLKDAFPELQIHIELDRNSREQSHEARVEFKHRGNVCCVCYRNKDFCSPCEASQPLMGFWVTVLLDVCIKRGWRPILDGNLQNATPQGPAAKVMRGHVHLTGFIKHGGFAGALASAMLAAHQLEGQ